MGAHLKSTFALNHGENTYLSQYLGNLDDFDTQLHYEHTLRYWLKLLEFSPQYVLVDLHPQYASSILGQEIAQELGATVLTIQHHEAHAAAILAEHDKCESKEEILCVVWDGTGLGWDGQIWGGESFLYARSHLERVGHLAYFPVLSRDKMAREPRLSALALAEGLPQVARHLQQYFNQTEWQFFQNLLGRVSMRSSSMGRLFDAVAAILGLASLQSYEGEAALQLETQAWRHVRQFGWPEVPAAPPSREPLAVDEWIVWLLNSLQKGTSVPELSAAFHVLLGKYIEAQAIQHGVSTIAFSGGVFQNALLTTWLREHLSADFQLLFHTQLPANDEHLAFGQMVRWQMEQSSFSLNSFSHVSRNSR
jgi:hydrogenase maturation protein HypF